MDPETPAGERGIPERAHADSGRRPPAVAYARVERRGLSMEEAGRRLAAEGPNEITRAEGPGALTILVRQFSGMLAWLLVAAAGVSMLLGEALDAAAIAAILALNVGIGFVQELRAERALEALRTLTAPRARVRRDGHARVVDSREVVRGDLLVLEAGDRVPADARLLEANRLECVEASLTGESLPVAKNTDPCPAGTPLAERTDHVFLGTSIASGTALAEVVGTGMRTELGRIAELLSRPEEPRTPLQHRLERVGRVLAAACGSIVVMVGVLGLARGAPFAEVLLGSISLAVAAVPEGLAAVVTVALALGVQRMAGRNVLVRRLASVETLGSATVICTDKTGTLTAGRMAVREVWGDERAVLASAAACCDAELDENRDTEGEGTGDPTELAILAAAARLGISRADVERENSRIATRPFETHRRRMSVLRRDGMLYVKGAVESVLPLCTEGTEGAEAENEELASRGLRVLAIATGRSAEERDLSLVGLVGLADPPRREVIDALAAARRAGIVTVMVTGDHPATARAIAREIGLVQQGEAEAERVHARVTPERKLAIVREWKARGAIVAMTGDGVNDAPAIREADIGIAMGRTGTDVSREASDMVLADDDYASIVAAVREGRGIFDNIRKTVVYLLAGNASELAVMLGAGLAGFPVPLLPLHLLWTNLVTDGLPALALVTDRPAPDVLERPPRPPKAPLLGRPEWERVLAIALVESAVVLAVFVSALGGGEGHARTMAFTTLVLAELFRAFAARHPELTLFEVGAFTNLRVLAVIAVSALLQVALFLLPWTRAAFDLVPLTPGEVAAVTAAALVPVTLVELAKLARHPAPARR